MANFLPDAAPTTTYRGGILVNYSRCKGCKLCLEVCPTDVFSFDEITRRLIVEP